jgi:YVTN family beta-propeller protein
MKRLPSLRLPAFAAVAVWAALPAPTARGAEAERKHPVYVGARVCAACHDGHEMGYQHSKWLLSKHARAYASLAMPEAKAIARFSGIPDLPQKSPMCLGCHATAHDAEDWEKDETFSIEDGIQCEKCHGPGSEYMDRQVMTNRPAAVKAGLRMPDEKDCLGCHKEKGSHRQVLHRPAVDIKWAWREIAHPTPENWSEPRPLALPKTGGEAGPQYVGAAVCGKCHDGPQSGHQFSRWRMGPHAEAFARLATAEAQSLARKRGVQGDPQRSQYCLKCHTTPYARPAAGCAPSFSLDEGVGCESCHGPGSDHARQAAAAGSGDPRRTGAANSAVPLKAGRDSCTGCHQQKDFQYEVALRRIAHPTKLPKEPDEPRYKTPIRLALRPDGRELYVACEASSTVIVVDALRREKAAEIPVGGQPTGLCFSPDGARAYVSNRLDDTVSVIDVGRRQVVGALRVGGEPHGVLTDRSGKTLYVLNASSDSISVIDTERLAEVKRLSAGRAPWSMVLSPDGTRIYVTNALSGFVELRQPSLSEVTIIDTDRAVVEERALVPGANMLLGIAVHPGGKYALATANRTKNLVPMTRLLQGWTITNSLAVVWATGRVDQVLLDQPDECFPDPTDVAITPDGRWALVTSGATDRVAVLDLAKLTVILESASDEDRRSLLPNHLGTAGRFVVKYIPVGNNPRGVVVTPDGHTAFVANALDDSLSVIDLDMRETAGRVDLGGPRQITTVRFGERLFNSARITFHRQFSCHTCHPDGHVDGLTFVLQPEEGEGGPLDNRTLRGILDTAPFKWNGTNPSLSRQCGARLAVLFTRAQPFTPEEQSALDNYISTIPRPPNRYRALGAPLTDAQRRGKAVFDRTVTNDGRTIPKDHRCATCHFPPLYTDRNVHNVGTQHPMDRSPLFDTPHLNNIYDSAPYLHDGVAHSLEEIWTRYNPDDRHGVTNDLTKDQLNDLIEYLRTL